MKLLFATPKATILITPHCQVDMSLQEAHPNVIPFCVPSNHRRKKVVNVQVKNGKLKPLEASHERLCSPPSRDVGSPLMSFGKSVHQILVVASFKFRSELTFRFNSGSFEIEPGVASAQIRYQLIPKVRRQRFRMRENVRNDTRRRSGRGLGSSMGQDPSLEPTAANQ